MDFLKERSQSIFFKSSSILDEDDEFQIFSTKKFSDNYILMEKIGEGGSAVVKRVVSKINGNTYAAKVIRTRDPEYLTSVKNEYSLLKKLDHPNIIKAYELIFDEESGFVYIILEFFNGPTLEDYLIEREKLSECETIEILKQLLSALKYLHDSYICHRDITTLNVLRAPNGKIKIIDFNISKKLKTEHETTIFSAPPNSKIKSRRCSQSICSSMLTPKGTLEFQAPEILMGSFYDQSIDMWSIGIITYQCLHGYRPFYSKMVKEMIDNIINCRYEINEELSNEARMFIKNCLTKSVFVRLSSKESLVHPWIKGFRMCFSDGVKSKSRRKRTLTPSHYDYEYGLPQLACPTLRKTSSEVDLLS